VLRVEDLDPPRVVPGSAERILEDLAWLGLDWNGEVVWQSKRSAAYEEAIAKLAARGLIYPCDCSRAEIARIASAPHAGEDLVYPGTCRDRDPSRHLRRAPALRFRVPDDAVVEFLDEVAGARREEVRHEVGDFVLKRGDGVYAYQLAVAVDDAAAGVTHVLRGADLLASTARQILLLRELGLRAPTYGHVPMVVAPDGARLAKRTQGATIRSLRDAGISASEIVSRLREALALDDRGIPTRKTPWPIPADWTVRVPHLRTVP
jgi:glutamyl-tRNA synthetase